MRNIILSPVIIFNHENNGQFTFKNERTGKNQKLSKHDYLNKLKEFLTIKKYPAGSASNFKTKYGIMPSHAFSLLEAKRIVINGETLDVLKIFNPYNRNL